MKRDIEFLTRLLMRMENEEHALYQSPQEVGGVRDKEQHHLRLAQDQGWVVQEGESQWRLTNAGHNLVERIRKTAEKKCETALREGVNRKRLDAMLKIGMQWLAACLSGKDE